MATDFTLPVTTSKPHSLKRIGAWVFMGFAALLCFWLFVLPVIVVALSSVASHWSGTIFPDGFSMRWFERLGSSDFDALTTSLEVGFGVAPAGAEESSIDQAKAIFETNFFGLIRMTRAVVPHMRRQGNGRIINIGSVLGFLPMPYGALYAATKHAVEGYSESLDHELRTRGIRVSVIEPAYTKTQFDANFLAPDSKLDEYREVRALLDKVLKEVMATADEPTVVADVVLEAAIADRPKLRYAAGGLANRLRLLRRFAPAGLVDAGIRKDLRLDAPTASLPRTPVLEK